MHRLECIEPIMLYTVEPSNIIQQTIVAIVVAIIHHCWFPQETEYHEVLRPILLEAAEARARHTAAVASAVIGQQCEKNLLGTC